MCCQCRRLTDERRDDTILLSRTITHAAYLSFAGGRLRSGKTLTWYRLPAIMRLAGLRSRCTIGDGFLLCMYASPRDASSASSTARRSDTACEVGHGHCVRTWSATPAVSTSAHIPEQTSGINMRSQAPLIMMS